jgi:hypothetical protein
MFMHFTTVWPAGGQGLRYPAFAVGYARPARALAVAVIARGYGTTAAIALPSRAGRVNFQVRNAIEGRWLP